MNFVSDLFIFFVCLKIDNIITNRQGKKIRQRYKVLYIYCPSFWYKICYQKGLNSCIFHFHQNLQLKEFHTLLIRQFEKLGIGWGTSALKETLNKRNLVEWSWGMLSNPFKNSKKGKVGTDKRASDLGLLDVKIEWFLCFFVDQELLLMVN